MDNFEDNTQKNNMNNKEIQRVALNEFMKELLKQDFPPENENYMRPSIDKHLEYYKNAVGAIRNKILKDESLDLEKELNNIIINEPKHEFFITKKTTGSFSKREVDAYVEALPQMFKERMTKILQ